jgi:hypothetical protein
MKNITIGDGIRTIGHMLEHHMTTEESARNADGRLVDYDSPYACKWCLIGAWLFVSKAFFNHNGFDWGHIESIVGVKNGQEFDALSPEQRLAVAKKLQAYSAA